MIVYSIKQTGKKKLTLRLFSVILTLSIASIYKHSFSLLQIDLKHIDQKVGEDKVEIGINLKQYYPSVEWDILGVPAERHEKYYPCCAEPYPGLYF